MPRKTAYEWARWAVTGIMVPLLLFGANALARQREAVDSSMRSISDRVARAEQDAVSLRRDIERLQRLLDRLGHSSRPR